MHKLSTSTCLCLALCSSAARLASLSACVAGETLGKLPAKNNHPQHTDCQVFKEQGPPAVSDSMLYLYMPFPFELALLFKFGFISGNLQPVFPAVYYRIS